MRCQQCGRTGCITEQVDEDGVAHLTCKCGADESDLSELNEDAYEMRQQRLSVWRGE
jgi:hypothetical protein